MALDFGIFLAEIRARDPHLALLLEKTQNGINQVAEATGTDATQHVSPPDAPSAINVKAAGGIAHVTITDNSQRSRALHYFVEMDTDPSFPAPHVEHLGVSRGRFVTLPGLNDSSATQNWYFRCYSMYPGASEASPHQWFGGRATPTPVTVGGSAALTPLASTGSGTASTLGVQGGTGFGTPQYSKAFGKVA